MKHEKISTFLSIRKSDFFCHLEINQIFWLYTSVFIFSGDLFSTN